MSERHSPSGRCYAYDIAEAELRSFIAAVRSIDPTATVYAPTHDEISVLCEPQHEAAIKQFLLSTGLGRG